MIDEHIISYVVRFQGLSEVQQTGISIDDFVDEYRSVWRYILRTNRDHDTIPSRQVLKARFPDIDVPVVTKTDLPLLIHQMKQRSKMMNFLHALNDAAGNVDAEQVDDIIQTLQGQLNNIAFNGSQRAHLVDLFSEEVNSSVMQEIKDRRSGRKMGIPTGLSSFDTLAGGMMPQQMIVVIGRSGIGKSWIDLMAMANAVMNDHKFILYPLEMSLFETATRLYTLFSQQMYGGNRTIRNFDLNSGTADIRKVRRFLTTLQDKFSGKLLVADVGQLSDPYTIERIEAEVDLNKPDGFWVDYLTLLKPPGSATGGDDGWQAVRQLSSGIKNIAMRRNVVGGCSAQVNREAIRANVFLPRLEHIAYGDSIGQDADRVISINRKGKYLYYSLVKNRHGAEFGSRKVKFDPDNGILREMPREQDAEVPDATDET